jgi:hypothetical protein
MRKDRRYGKPDAVQKRVVDALRELPGVDALVISAEIDIIVGHKGRNYILELKSPPEITHRARGSVREKQADLRARWPGQYDVVEIDPDDPNWLKETLKIIGYRKRRTRT